MMVNVIHSQYDFSKIRCCTGKEGGGVFEYLEHGISVFLGESRLLTFRTSANCLTTSHSVSSISYFLIFISQLPVSSLYVSR